MSVNVNRNVQDTFYRYKMPKLTNKIEGRGNGIKTVLPNIEDVAKALSRPATFATKFFGFELGAQVIMDEKTGKYIVNGAHDTNKLCQLLDTFIAKFVLCADCGNPETVLKISKDSFIYRDCKACGKKSDLDMKHKLTTYILKNPPPGSTLRSTKEKKKSKEDKRENGTSERLTPSPSGTSDQDEAQLIETIESVEIEDPIEIFAHYLERKEKHTASQILEKIEELGLKRYKAVPVYIQCVFTDDLMRELKEHTQFLKEVVNDQKTQLSLLGGLERFIGVAKPQLLNKAVALFKYLYDSELVEEEVIMAWHSDISKSKKYAEPKVSAEVRQKLTPFIQWLQQAEEEETDEDEESDEEQ